jgi:hypothetical protein
MCVYIEGKFSPPQAGIKEGRNFRHGRNDNLVLDFVDYPGRRPFSTRKKIYINTKIKKSHC